MSEKENTREILKSSRPGDISYRLKRNKVTLKRALEIPDIFSIGYGTLGSSIYFALGIVILHALGATPFVLLVVALVFIFTAQTYAEGTSAIPEAGGSSSFARQAFNEMVSFIAAWCLLLAYIAATAISAFFAITYLGNLSIFSFLKIKAWTISATALLLGVLMVLNIIGIKKSSLLNVVLAGIDVATQFFLVLLGAVFFFNLPKLMGHIHWGVAPTWNQAAIAAFLAMIHFTGIENVANLAEESKSPQTTIPRSMWWSLAIFLLLYLGLSSVALSAMPVTFHIEGYVYTNPEIEKIFPFTSTGKKPLVYYKEITSQIEGHPVESAKVTVGDRKTYTDKKGYFRIDGIPYGANTLHIKKAGYFFTPITFDNTHTGPYPVKGKWSSELVERWHDNPVSGIASKLPVFGKPFEVWIPILAFTMLIIATNSGILGVSRLIFSMGTHRQIPPILAKLHPKYRTPYIAIIIFTIVSFLLIVSVNSDKIADILAFSAMIPYFIAHISIIVLRIKKPDLPRPYKVPFSVKFKNREIPIPALIGAFTCFVIWVIASITIAAGRNIGIIFLIIGITTYIIYRKSQGLSLTKTISLKE